MKLYDVVRIDHFRGFDEYYAIPYGDKTAENGKWEKGPGLDLFHVLKKEIGELHVIAEGPGIFDKECPGNAERQWIPGNESPAVCF